MFIFSELRIYAKYIYDLFLEYVLIIVIHCGDTILSCRIFLRQCSPAAMHAFNVLCIPNCVDLYVFQILIILHCISRHYH